MAAKAEAAERDARQMRWAVWHVAALPRLKRFPRASEFIDPAKRGVPGAPKPRQTPQQMFDAMRQWTKFPAPDGARPKS